MEEIAAEAGVSKPTLYATFRNKDAALGGAIRFAKRAQLLAVQKEWGRAGKLSKKLDVFFDQLVLAGFDMLHNSPDAAAFETAVGESSEEAIESTRAAEIEAVRGLFERSERLAEYNLDPQRYASFFVDSAMNAKRLTRSRSELERHLETLKAATVVLLEPEPSVSKA
ncbi:MAG: TetR family transcriptional regulator [Pseudomonadota bacterium]